MKKIYVVMYYIKIACIILYIMMLWCIKLYELYISFRAKSCCVNFYGYSV